MTEEITEPTEPEVKQTNTKGAIEIMIEALRLAEKATGYTAATTSQPGRIYYDRGRQTGENPTYSAYIGTAEKTIVKKRMAEILEEAHRTLRAELDDIRELLK